MNQWTFVLAAYAVGYFVTAATLVWASQKMRRAEAAADELTRR